jgi:hypothetical protein
MGKEGKKQTYDEPVASRLFEYVPPSEKCDSSYIPFHPPGLLLCLLLKAALSNGSN